MTASQLLRKGSDCRISHAHLHENHRPFFFSSRYNALNLTFSFFQKYACGSVLASSLMWLFQFAADPNPKRTAAL